MSRDLDVVGIGSMAVDRMHRAARILGGDEKGMLRPVEGAGSVKLAVGGVVLNHLGWAAALGLRVGIFGRQGDDGEGRFLRDAMDGLGIERHIDLVEEPTTVAEIFVDADGRRAIYMAPGATATTRPEHVRRGHAEFIRRSARLSTEVSQLPLDTTLAALRVASEAGIPTVVDLDVPPADALETLGDEATLEAVLRAADLLKPTKGAVEALAPEAAGDSLALARAIRKRFGNRAVVLTDGEAGCAIAANGFEGRAPGYVIQVRDTTGAGDAFLGGLLVALHYQLDWPDAARLANACGAACAEQLGAFPEDSERARARVLELYDGPPLSLGATPTADRSDAARRAASQVLSTAASELSDLAARHVDGAALEAAALLVEATRRAGGRVHATGVGKPEHVARYAASLLSSTGVPATFLHATEALHGSLGQVEAGDVVVAVSNSGTTREICEAVRALRGQGARIVAVTGRLDSDLAHMADVSLDASVSREGGPLGLAPRASVAAEMLVVAALAAMLQERQGFGREDYARRHPSGALGERSVRPKS